MNVTIIGVGLIGGSLGLELRSSNRFRKIVGVDASEAHASQAVASGLVDEILDLNEGVSKADVVLLAVPVHAIAHLLPEVLNDISPDAIVIDTGSTKAAICKSVEHHPKRGRFVAAHPIAGTENSGPAAAFYGLFSGKLNIVCEKERSDEDALKLALDIFSMAGMRTIFMDPDEHDRHLAYVSHLSHVSSFLLGQTVLDIEQNEKQIAMLAGSGFASTVRLAKSSPDMWAPIFEQNREYLSQALQEYIIHLQRFQYHLMKGNTNELYKIMQQANEIRRILNGISNTINEKTLVP